MLDGVVEVLERRRTAPIGDRGMIISVVSWILLVALIFTLIGRFAVKLTIPKKEGRLGLDDLFIGLAALFSVGQTIAVSIESMHALGTRKQDWTDKQMAIFQKAEYASCMLYIANMGCARISVCFLIKKIFPRTIPRVSACVFASFTLLWTISGVFVTAFPCPLPNPWKLDFGRCFDLVKWINYVAITNIVVEVLLVIVPLVVWNLRLSTGRRLSISSCFLARLSIVGAVSAQLAFFNRYVNSADFTYDYWRTVLCIQIAQNLSVITACLPVLHPFVIKILAGKIKTEALAFNCRAVKGIQDCFQAKSFKFDSTSSHSSTLPIKDPDDYCRPLATYGLDRSSAHLHSQHFNRFPTSSHTAPVSEPNPPENVFNRSIEIPRPGAATSHPTKDLPPIPKNLSEVGVLPIIDWDTESSDRGSGRSSPSRRRDSEYVFKREKVISVPEADVMTKDGEYYKKYYPPLPSPGMPKRPRGP